MIMMIIIMIISSFTTYGQKMINQGRCNGRQRNQIHLFYLLSPTHHHFITYCYDAEATNTGSSSSHVVASHSPSA